MNRNELMKLYLEEAEEQIQLLEQEIMILEQEGGKEAVIQRLFRAAHTLKGSSAAMGFEDIKNLTHEMENVLDRMRTGSMSVSEELINTLFRCLDTLNMLKSQVEQGVTTGADIREVVKELRRLAAGEEAAAISGLAIRKTCGENIPLVSKERELLNEVRAAGLQGRFVEVKVDGACQMKAARALLLHKWLEEKLMVLYMYPPVQEIGEEQEEPLKLRFLLTGHEWERIESECREICKGEGVEDIRFLDEELHPLEQAQPAAADESSLMESSSPVQQPGNDSKRTAGASVRVDVERLENLINLVGELVIDQTRITQVGSVIRDLLGSGADDTMDDFDSIANHISRVVGELQESVMKTRMLPIERLFTRFPRMVRDLSHKVGKSIQLILEGKETEVDRTVIEEITDPLIHLIRNSLDHGIETPDVRRRAGKPETGIIRLSAEHKENQVVLSLVDDGAGIDPRQIGRIAVSKQLITQTQASQMSEQELIQLIFEPGFSTAKELSDISGRGVGMDIVRSHIEKLNGLIDVDTRLGAGTTFTIKLPLTLAIVRGLLIRIHQSVYALPISSVVEIMRLPGREIHSIKGQRVVMIRDKVLQLVWVHDFFNVPKREFGSDNNVFIVIIGSADRRMALVVDELIGNQEIVVKSMGAYVGKVEGISGATILGDGGVALIMDVTGIFNLAGRDRIAKEEING
ncbi:MULTISPECIES: chemotaxis protein CheA [unclassified Paenibacillus]|uniref:chemotaxis protein CheA n=1 Tax=unclassified Paenibacillus TaxID=185978 RepID=UPI002406FF73|nr:MULTISPECIES: chemotaxis protein CheA [unclassified Paenibacillus]MDF9839509.1 two-component system chemotaxis sensor kinase CheA [Paenibacillus sp. PastF-2]MDF9846090.1 two-component system chemotaxis sensor kinase CheA [Paenibacillus sp. PastM-2]MDF9852663.1 two-component system chemotaxis sensor kinase CheA [Paenibacillus sp. PastF-1]MDH6477606.1 two-component system chemotaxis sensor kinase CheA [Paenibacillus sp. PastH-2]MDH6505349.1 two-component system chemotaxis sensor kinase CheA [